MGILPIYPKYYDRLQKETLLIALGGWLEEKK